MISLTYHLSSVQNFSQPMASCLTAIPSRKGSKKTKIDDTLFYVALLTIPSMYSLRSVVLSLVLYRVVVNILYIVQL